MCDFDQARKWQLLVRRHTPIAILAAGRQPHSKSEPIHVRCSAVGLPNRFFAPPRPPHDQTETVRCVVGVGHRWFGAGPEGAQTTRLRESKLGAHSFRLGESLQGWSPTWRLLGRSFRWRRFWKSSVETVVSATTAATPTNRLLWSSQATGNLRCLDRFCSWY